MLHPHYVAFPSIQAAIASAQYKSQLSERDRGEYIVRFGLAAFNALPDYPGAPEPGKRKTR